MGTTIVCRAGGGEGGGAGGGARAEICECPGAPQDACKNGPVKGEGRNCECIYSTQIGIFSYKIRFHTWQLNTTHCLSQFSIMTMVRVH